MPKFKMMKTAAKGTLAHRWGSAIAVLAVSLSISILLSLLEQMMRMLLNLMPQQQEFETFSDLTNYYGAGLDDPVQALPGLLISLLFFVLGLLFSTPISLGEKRYYWGVSAGAEETTSAVFFYLSSGKMYLRAVVLQLQIYLRLFGYGILLSLPGIVLAVLSRVSELASPVLLLLSYLAGAGGAVLLISLGLRYAMAGYILVNDDTIRPVDAIRRSHRMMKGYKSSLFLFLLSFIGWFALCLFALPVIYVFPYYNASKAHFAHYLMQHYAKIEMAEKSGNTQIIVY